MRASSAAIDRAEVRRILVLKWSAMGDVALASAGIEDIARAFPGREIDLSTLPPWDRLYRHDPRLARVIDIDVRAKRGQPGAVWRWLKAVARRRYDLVFDLQTTDRSRLLLGLLWLVGGQIRYRAGNLAAAPYNLFPREPAGRHAMQILAATLGAAGVSAATPRPVLHCPAERRRAARALLAAKGVGPNYAVFLPGSQAAGYLKRWGAERFAALGRWLIERGYSRIVLLGGPDELEECRAIERSCGAWLANLCGLTELLDIVPVCEGARVIVGNDTGTAHVAAAAARPMLIICGPTDPGRVLPAGDNVASAQAPLVCINCYKKRCAHHTCMAWLTPAMIGAQLERLGVL